MSSRRQHSSVPRTDQVVPGAFVHIVLKQDQPTGRTVQGTVQTLLTHGNHPRGIKVRLSDGRVGRVQAMANGPAATSEASSSYAPRSSLLDNPVGNNEDDVPRQQIGLDAYIKPARSKKQNGRKNAESQENGCENAESQESGCEDAETPEIIYGQPVEPSDIMHWGGSEMRPSSPSVTCPVCGIFEGDEAAVSHHVATHFEAGQ